jgi:lipopolysaccharide transport system ATP-binding protein
MPVIEVSHLTKEYRLGAIQGIKQTLLNTCARLIGKSVPERSLFKALDDVNFSIEQGEVVGIIGHNGAGKSTLLKMLAKISTPTHGSVKVNGRIAPLIEVGAGFVPDFTGRENVYLNGAILGMSKQEIDQKFDEIVDFAEMAEFIDTPVKRYSSGMQVKLAFAVATSIESEILIVDEVLAVGDLAFQRKCFDRMETLINAEHRTVLVVSHNLRQIERLCKRVLLIDHGKIIADGEPKPVCNRMFEEMDAKISAQTKQNAKQKAGGGISDGSVELIDIFLADANGQMTNTLKMGSNATLKVRYLTHQRLVDPIFGVGIHTSDFIYLSTEQSYGRLNVGVVEQGIHELSFMMKTIPLLPGVYSFRLGIADGKSGGASFYKDNALHFQITASGISRAWNTASDEGFFALDAEWAISHQESKSVEH